MSEGRGEPDLATEPRLLTILEELRAREPIFHRPEFGTTRADFEALTAEDFWEVGASGRRYSRAFVLDVLERRGSSPQEAPWETSGFHCRELGGATYARPPPFSAPAAAPPACPGGRGSASAPPPCARSSVGA